MESPDPAGEMHPSQQLEDHYGASELETWIGLRKFRISQGGWQGPASSTMQRPPKPDRRIHALEKPKLADEDVSEEGGKFCDYIAFL